MTATGGYRRRLDDTAGLSCLIEGFYVKDGHTVCRNTSVYFCGGGLGHFRPKISVPRFRPKTAVLGLLGF